MTTFLVYSWYGFCNSIFRAQNITGWACLVLAICATLNKVSAEPYVYNCEYTIDTVHPLPVSQLQQFISFSCDQAALITLISVCLSVLPSVCHTFLTMFQEISPLTDVMSMQKVKVKGQGHRGHDPTEPFLDRNFLNSHMAKKWCTKLDVA